MGVRDLGCDIKKCMIRYFLNIRDIWKQESVVKVEKVFHWKVVPQKLDRELLFSFL